MGKSCAITGHRPSRFIFKYNEADCLCKKIKTQMRLQFENLIRNGFTRFYAGGALGVDMWSSEMILELKKENAFEDIELFIAIPFDGYNDHWDNKYKSRMEYIIENCNKSEIIGNRDNINMSYKKRNQFMVDNSDYLLAVYDIEKRRRSGTQQTVNYAIRQALPVIIINPDTGVVSKLNREGSY